MTRRRNIIAPHFYIDIPPWALLKEGNYCDSLVWQLIGLVDELARFEGIEAILGSPKDSDEVDVAVTRLFVGCDPTTPAGQVLLYFAGTITSFVRAEEEYLADMKPDKPDFSPAKLDWLFPIRKTLQMGGKLKKEEGSPAELTVTDPTKKILFESRV